MTNEEAKDYIREWCPYDRQQEIIEALSNSDEDCRWIPVSKKYPDKSGNDKPKEYLVCYEWGEIYIERLYFTEEGEPFFSGMNLGIVAWMPLPEPYKGGTQHDETFAPYPDCTNGYQPNLLGGADGNGGATA